MHFPGSLGLDLGESHAVEVLGVWVGFVLFFSGGHRMRTWQIKLSWCLRFWHSVIKFLFVFPETQAGSEISSGFDFCFHVFSFKIYHRHETPRGWFQCTGSGS